MKSTLFVATALAGLSDALPNIAAHLHDNARSASAAASRAKRQTPLNVPPFEAAAQLVSTTGSHAFVAPRSTDQRGPCPGLNAVRENERTISSKNSLTRTDGKSWLSSPQRYREYHADH